MSGRCLALWLFTALVAGTVSGQLSNADTKISISFNPCDDHACPAGQTCKAVFNPRLLQLPVARCVKSSTTGDNGECTEAAVGSNILNCKTEAEWTKIARIQCMLRGGTNSMQFTALQLYHACYSRTSGSTKFLSAAFSCCLTQAASPSAETTPSASNPPNNDKPVPPKAPGSEQAATEQVSTSSSNTGSSTAAVQDDLVSTSYHYYIMALFAVVVLLIAGLIVVCTVTRRRTQRRKSSSKAPPTVYINPSCEDHHNHLKHSHSNTTLLSTPDIALVQHQY